VQWSDGIGTPSGVSLRHFLPSLRSVSVINFYTLKRSYYNSLPRNDTCLAIYTSYYHLVSIVFRFSVSVLRRMSHQYTGYRTSRLSEINAFSSMQPSKQFSIGSVKKFRLCRFHVFRTCRHHKTNSTSVRRGRFRGGGGARGGGRLNASRSPYIIDSVGQHCQLYPRFVATHVRGSDRRFIANGVADGAGC
jgi:hypothetical protein